MHSPPRYDPTIFFVTGPPRSGTTFLSDWITECTTAYCAHEIIDSLPAPDPDGITTYLHDCAATGKDRLSKTLQRDFLRWDHPRTKIAPPVLGFKEPIVWRSVDALPYAVAGYLEAVRARCIVTTRHPYDVIISGKERAARTRNWPTFGVAEHCELWCTALPMADFYHKRGLATLLIRWERLILEFAEVRNELQDFLHINLPLFAGNERSNDYIASLRTRISMSGGVRDRHLRAQLSNEERAIVRNITGGACSCLGYTL